MTKYIEHLTDLPDFIKSNKKTMHAVNRYSDMKKYIGHGTHVLAFLDQDTKLVTKCCFSHSGTLMEDTGKFKEQLQHVSKFSEILLPIDIKYIDKNLVVYTQDFAKPIVSVDKDFIVFMFNFVKKMLRIGMKFPDIYFRNFSLLHDKYNNKYKLFDFHNYESIFNNNNFFITNIYNNVLKYINQDQLEIKRMDYIATNDYKFPTTNNTVDIISIEYVTEFLRLLGSLSTLEPLRDSLKEVRDIKIEQLCLLIDKIIYSIEKPPDRLIMSICEFLEIKYLLSDFTDSNEVTKEILKSPDKILYVKTNSSSKYRTSGIWVLSNTKMPNDILCAVFPFNRHKINYLYFICTKYN